MTKSVATMLAGAALLLIGSVSAFSLSAKPAVSMAKRAQTKATLQMYGTSGMNGQRSVMRSGMNGQRTMQLAPHRRGYNGMEGSLYGTSERMMNDARFMNNYNMGYGMTNYGPYRQGYGIAGNGPMRRGMNEYYGMGMNGRDGYSMNGMNNMYGNMNYGGRYSNGYMNGGRYGRNEYGMGMGGYGGYNEGYGMGSRRMRGGYGMGMGYGGYGGGYGMGNGLMGRETWVPGEGARMWGETGTIDQRMYQGAY